MINGTLDQEIPRVRQARRGRSGLAVVAVGACIVLGLALLLPMAWRLEQELRASAQAAVDSVADDVARQLSEDLTNRQREMVLMAEMIGSRHALDAQAVQKAMDGLRGRHAAYAWIGLADARGRVIAALDGLLEGADVSLRPWFAAGLRGGFVGDPHDAVLLARYLAPRPNGEPLRFLDVAAPLRDENGAVQGVMAGHLHWDWVQQAVSEVVARRRQDSSPLEVLIANRKGEWLLAVGAPYKLPEATLQAVQAESGYLVATRRVATATPVDNLGWTVVVREAAGGVPASIYQLRSLVFAFVALVAVLAALSAWLLLGRARQRSAGPLHAVAGLGVGRRLVTDGLTRLPGRVELLERLQQTIARVQAGGASGALLLVDLDDFGQLNQARGQEAGDQVLILAAGRLRRIDAAEAVVGRGGGDKFLVLLEYPGSDAGQALARASAAGAAALAALREPFVLESGACLAQASIGIAPLGADAASAEELLYRAEQALRQAKQQGKNQAVVFSEGRGAA